MRRIFFEGMVDQQTGLQIPASAASVIDRHYYNDMVNYVLPAQVVSQDANEITFYNMGTSTVSINGLIFPPGCGIGFDGNQDEIDDTKYQVIFLPYTGALPSFVLPGNNCFVTRKCYMK